MCNGILFSHKKDQNLAILYNVDATWHNAWWNKSEKEKYCVIYLIYGIYKNKNNQTKQSKTTSS